MDGQTAVWLLVVLLSVVLNSAEAQNQMSYFEVGSKLLLRPDPVCSHISTIVWTHNGDLVTDWTEQFVGFDYYRIFGGRASLNSINNLVQLYGYDAVAIHKVSVLCSQTSRSCWVSCDGDIEEPGPDTFYWKKGVGGRDQGDQSMTVTKNEDMQTVPAFCCQMKNPVSEREGNPPLNVFNLYETTLNG
uniref:Ig-like domain-containing protein n=1 Tax=Acanthochromis polyacanthus TaxID=80966 RepID=A0A3Q1EWG2_9TELE